MIDLITKIFDLFDFKKIGGNEIALFKSESIDDYWLVCKGEPKTFTYEYQAELLRLCQEICVDRALEKNLNLLCLWQVDVIDHSTISQLHLLEEDIYFFKKHVLYYTSQEFLGIKEELEAVPLNDLVTNYPINPDIYTRYKENIENDCWEALLYRLCIKLAFISITVSEGEAISNLHATHDAKLSRESELNILDDLVQNLDKDYLDGSPEDLFDFINSSLADKL